MDQVEESGRNVRGLIGGWGGQQLRDLNRVEINISVLD
jgi:hypothetical protein